MRDCLKQNLHIRRVLYPDANPRLLREVEQAYQDNEEVLAQLGIDIDNEPESPPDYGPKQLECEYGPDTITIRARVRQ